MISGALSQSVYRPYLHQRWEEIPVGEIGDEAGLVCPTGHGDGHSDCLAAYLD